MTAAVLDRETTPEFDLIINGKDTVNKIMKAQIQVGKVVDKYKSRLVGKPTMWFPTRSDINRPVQSQKRARILKFRI